MAYRIAPFPVTLSDFQFKVMHPLKAFSNTTFYSAHQLTRCHLKVRRAVPLR